MPVVNPLARELVFKVVYYGPGLGGKTTTLQHIHSATRPEYRGKMVSLATPVDRTLYFDFLPIRVPALRGMGVRLQLFTVPGQVYYNATRKLVLTGADGVVLVADSQRGRQDANLESLENLEENLREHGRELKELPLILQYNKRDLRDVRPVEDLDQELNPRGVPSLGTVATTGVGVFEALSLITSLVLADFERRMPVSSDLPGAGLQVPEGGLAEALRRADFEPEEPTALSAGTPAAQASGSGMSESGRSRVSTRTMPEAADLGAWQAEQQREASATEHDETSFAGLSDDEPDSADGGLARLSHAPQSTIGEDMARSVAEFAAPRSGDAPRVAAPSAALGVGDRSSTEPGSVAPPQHSFALASSRDMLPRGNAIDGLPNLELSGPELAGEGAQAGAEEQVDAAGSVGPGSVRPGSVRPGSGSFEALSAASIAEAAAAPQSARPGLQSFSFCSLFPRSQQRIVRELEDALASGDTSHAVERAEHLVTRTFAAAANLVSQKEAPRDPTLVALMLGLPGQRYLEFRAIARDARSGGVVATEDALIAYAFAVDARLAWRRVGG